MVAVASYSPANSTEVFLFLSILITLVRLSFPPSFLFFSFHFFFLLLFSFFLPSSFLLPLFVSAAFLFLLLPFFFSLSLFLNNGHPRRSEVITHSGFELLFLNAVEHLSIWLLAVCLFSLEKYLLESFVHF